MIFIQFFKIIFIFWKYRLDLLLPELNLNLFFKILYVINPLRLIPVTGSKGERLFSALLAAGPVYVKLGQILSTRSDLFDDEMTINFAVLAIFGVCTVIIVIVTSFSKRRIAQNDLRTARKVYIQEGILKKPNVIGSLE